MSSATLATGTPVVSVHDNRGLAVRALNWNRKQDGAPLRLLVTHSQTDEASRVVSHRDPRLFAGWKEDSTVPANLRTTPSLAGQILRRESTDGGVQVTLSDAAGRPVWIRDGRGTVQTVAYDELGRPESGCEQLSGSDDIRVSWRSDYGDSSPADDGSRGNNLRGVCVAQYDDGGLAQVSSVALSGAVLSRGQCFLASVDGLPDWPAEKAGREALLEAGVYTTTAAADARGAPLNQTDAMGHIQRWQYDVSGAACGQTVALAGEDPQPLLTGVTRSAAGQVLTESAGNGVTTTCSYDPQTQWLTGITALDAAGNTLQDLAWGYDFTGNVTSLSDGNVVTGYYRNQATDGKRRFTYDALYQLLGAEGRENAGNAGMQYSSLPAVVPDGSQYVNYTRRYSYDDSGNLQSLSHSGAGSYTRSMTIEETSNRSAQQNDGGPQNPGEVAGWFDSNGNLLKLQAGASVTEPLAWDGNNNLQSVILVSRSSDGNDREIYQYSGSRRVRKQTRTLVNGERHLWGVDEVRYLPGLELRRSWQETAGEAPPAEPAEELHVVTGQAGRAGIRVLHWETGKPDGIENNQVRWSVDDNLGSLMLELDAEGGVISREEYYPFGGTAVWAARNEVEANYKTVRYSGKERDSTGLYYYGHRYYAPWLCRWVSADPAGEVDGLNLFRMVRNNPVSLKDIGGMAPIGDSSTTGMSVKERSKLLEQNNGNAGEASDQSVRPKVPPRPAKLSTSPQPAVIPAHVPVRSQPKTPQEIFDRFGANYHPENRTYPFEMMQEITQNKLNYSNQSLSAKSLEKIAGMKFTLRHYTSAPEGQAPSFNEISTNMDLVKKGVKSLSRSSGSNTNEDDWRRLGNTGFTFFLLSINGEVANRKFLANSTHYAEFSIDELIQILGPETEFFASADLLHEKNLSSAKAIKGKLGDLKSLLAAAAEIPPVQLGRLDKKGLLSAIDKAFGNTLEIKIPGNVKLTSPWNKV